MGLFDFFSSKQKDSLDVFYNDCLTSFHKKFAGALLNTEEPVSTSKVTLYGPKAVRRMMDDAFLRNEFSNSQVEYYLYLNTYCYQLGIACSILDKADKLDELFDQIILEGPTHLSYPFLQSIGLPKELCDKLNSLIYKLWREKTERYLNGFENNQYVEKACLASYQLGASVFLQHWHKR